MGLMPVTVAPPSPRARLTLGVTGHHDANPAFAANSTRIIAALEDVFDIIQTAQSAMSDRANIPLPPPRLHSLLADGTDQLAARSVLDRGWELVAPLPFGRRLNAAINARPSTPEDGRTLLAGGVASEPATRARAQALDDLVNSAQLFELADHDAVIAAHYMARLEAPEDLNKAKPFAAIVSERVALAARVMIEQSDILIAVWDGASRFSVGGTGHTIYAALSLGTPVVWIDTRTPEAWRILLARESLPPQPAPLRAEAGAQLTSLVRAALLPPASSAAKDSHGGLGAIDEEVWEPHSHPLSHAYRRIEALFGGDRHPWRNLRQTYESPEDIGHRSGAGILAALRALPGADPILADAVEIGVLRRFAWADGVSARLSDIYRGGMTSNFILSAAAIISGVAYLPFVNSDDKGPFAAVEFMLLAAILGITWLGQKRRWHGRWFETRRVAEYLRHAPILLAIGVARPVGRWPKGSDTSWPEWYARQSLQEIGLPRATITAAYLRAALEHLLDPHVVRQRDYHIAKAQRLTKVHHNLDRLSELSFLLAVISVTLCLGLMVGETMHLVAAEAVYRAAQWLTLTGVILPTLGAAISGIRYFGDFERFAAISKVTAEKLDAVHQRISLLLVVPEEMLDYDRVSDVVHTSDDIVVSEIESWQSVFSNKHITVPV